MPDSTPPGARGQPAWCLLSISASHFATHALPASGRAAIGRGPSCTVRIDDPGIGEEHAALHVGEGFSIEDSGSAGGTWVRGERLAAGRAVPVRPGEPISLGPVLLVVHERTALQPRSFWTHGYFELRVEEECARASRRKGSFGILRVQVERGSEARAEEVLGRTLRLMDVLARYAPGQFEVLLCDAEPELVQVVNGRVADALGRAAIEHSIRVACYPRDGSNSYALMATLGSGAGAASPPAPAASGTAMRGIEAVVERVAGSDISVLILGETGVGKERLAETVHTRSARKERPFLRLNCGALSETLLESELFGHERGAFTGADRTKPGLLETAAGGTVLLDEVGELPASIQVKLLRVLEERKVLAVGGLQPRAIDVRFIAATNRDLEASVGRGVFRADLFYRLNAVTLVIPPLRERGDEVGPMAERFVAEFSRRLGKDAPPALSKEATALLLAYRWPGNIRELRNVCERAVLLCAGPEIRAEHLPLDRMSATVRLPAQAGPEAALLAGGEGDERERISHALAVSGGNQAAAADLLGVSRRTLLKRLDQYNLPRPRKGRG